MQDVSAKDALQLMLMTQYFDTVKDIGVGNKASTIFLNHSPSALADLSGQMRAAFMEASVVQTMQR